MPRNELPGILIAIDGIAGAGKTTQVGKLADALTAAKFEVITSEEPTNGRWGRTIRQAATSGWAAPMDELVAHLMDRTESVEQRISPALARGTTVIMDGYFLPSIPGLGGAGQNRESIQRLMEGSFPIPDLLILLDIDAETSHERGSRHQPEISGMALTFFRGVSGLHVVTVDGRGSIESVHRKIVEALLKSAVTDRWSARAMDCLRGEFGTDPA